MGRGSLGVLKHVTLAALRIGSAEKEDSNSKGSGARAIEGSESEEAKEKAKQRESREEGRRQSAKTRREGQRTAKEERASKKKR